MSSTIKHKFDNENTNDLSNMCFQEIVRKPKYKALIINKHNL